MRALSHDHFGETSDPRTCYYYVIHFVPELYQSSLSDGLHCLDSHLKRPQSGSGCRKRRAALYLLFFFLTCSAMNISRNTIEHLRKCEWGLPSTMNKNILNTNPNLTCIKSSYHHHVIGSHYWPNAAYLIHASF